MSKTNYTNEIRIQHVPDDLKNEIKFVAKKSDITVSQLLKPVLRTYIAELPPEMRMTNFPDDDEL
jgi:hypothetical protein